MQGHPSPNAGIIKNGKTLLSGIDPVRRAEKVADAVSVKDRTLYFCPSPLYGYGLERFLSRLEKEANGSAVLCIEADPQLYELSTENFPHSLAADKKLALTDICGIEEICAHVRGNWGARAFRRVEIIRFSGGWQLFPDLYDSLCEALRRQIANDWSNALTLTKLGRLYIRNALRNLPLLLHFSSIAQLSFGEAPILVLGAGPSLDEVLDCLAGYFAKEFADPENRCFKIVCVDTALGALKDRGIVPDLAVILESQHWNLRDFIGCRGWNVPAAIDLSALPASALLLNEGFFFMTPWTCLSIFERLRQTGLLPAIVAPLGSVGLSAVQLSRQLTAGKIICAGLDFSFTQDKFHARSTPGHRDKLNRHTRFGALANTAAFDAATVAAVSKSGSLVYTNAVLQNYRSLFEQEFSGDLRLFDIEGTGLSLGLKTLSAKEVISELSFGNSCIKPVQKLNGVDKMRLDKFLEEERKRLLELRSILTGETAAGKMRLKELISECDYLWAHFPDCAGGVQPDSEDVSFLKRLRTEIDPMLKIIL
jgi:hypothetical protein